MHKHGHMEDSHYQISMVFLKHNVVQQQFNGAPNRDLIPIPLGELHVLHLGQLLHMQEAFGIELIAHSKYEQMKLHVEGHNVHLLLNSIAEM